MCAYLFQIFIPFFENSVDPDQLASNETSIRIYTSGSTPNIESNRKMCAYQFEYSFFFTYTLYRVPLQFVRSKNHNLQHPNFLYKR